ncbi:MAG: hypothetical protein ACREQZ_13220 [Woeseiaceae bacterium]
MTSIRINTTLLSPGRSARRPPGGLAILAALLAGPAAAQSSRQPADLSLEELGLIEVTLVSRKAEPLLDAPASVFVITRDEMERAAFLKVAWSP